ARLQRPRHLVGEVDVAGSVDEVQLVALPRDADGLRLDRDPALALEVHRVEQLLPHLARRHRLGDLHDAVGQRRLPMVDVGDDREVADLALVHGIAQRWYSSARFPWTRLVHVGARTRRVIPATGTTHPG